MPRKPRFPNPSNAAPNSEAPTEDNTVGKLHRTSHISVVSSQPMSHPEPSSGNGARARQSEIRPFRPPHDKALTIPSDSLDNRHPPDRCPTHVYRPVVDNTDTEDEDYVPGSDELESFDDHIDNLFAAHNAEQQQNVKKRNRNKPWKVDVIEDGKIRHLPHTVFDANSIPAGRKIVLDIDEYNQPVGEGADLLGGFLGGLGADFKALPISMKGWHDMKDYKESVYNDVIKRTFHFEDPTGDVKEGILKKLGKNWKDTRSHLFNTFYDDTKSEDENVKKHKPPDIDPEHWRFFLMYRLSDDIQEKCKKNAENRAKQAYTHTGGSKTLARRREEEERTHGKKFSRGEIWTMTHKKSDGSYIHEDARTVAEAIKVIETCDPSTKELSQNDSLAQVLGKEHPGRLRGMGAGPCPTQMINRGTQQTNFASHMAVEEYERQIVELRAKNVEVEKKAQTLEDIVRYLVQQQGNNLPPMIAAKMDSLGSGASSTDTQDLHGPP